MTTNWEPQQATMEMVLRALVIMAQANAYTLEVHDRWRLIQAVAAPNFTFTDVTGTPVTTNLADTSFNSTVDLWMSDAFREVRIEDITDPESMSGAWPQLRLIPGRGRDVETDDGYGHGYRSWEFPIECAIITAQDQPGAAQRDALVMADAWDSMLRRNEYLGGLVQRLSIIGAPIPGGYGRIAGDLLAAALIHLEVRVIKR